MDTLNIGSRLELFFDRLLDETPVGNAIATVEGVVGHCLDV